MSILIDKSTRLVVQGITGRDGLFHAKKMKEYGTNVVGGTSPGKGGMNVDGIPVFNTMYEAVEQTQANTSIIFVPARFAADAIMEAVLQKAFRPWMSSRRIALQNKEAHCWLVPTVRGSFLPEKVW